MTFWAMARWQPMASMVATVPSIAQHIEKRRDGDDLVRFIRDLHLAEHETLPRREGGYHMDGGLSFPLFGGSA